MKLTILLIFLSSIAYAQNDLKIAEIGDLKTQNGQLIKNCKVGYRTFGRLNAEASNAILFPTYFGGKSADLKGNLGILLDTTRFFVILVDALGNGISSSPSNTPNFPEITIRDMVNSQHHLVTKVLKINQLYTVMGISMGGMQTFEWLVAYPTMMQKAVSIVGTPRQSYYDQLLWLSELAIIESAQGNKKDLKNAMKLVANIHQLNLFSPQYWNMAKKTETPAVFLKSEGEKYAQGNHPLNWAAQLKAMIKHDIYQSSGKSLNDLKAYLSAKILIITASQDAMVNPAAANEFAQNLQTDFLELSGPCGHLATVCESEKLIMKLKAFFK
jgi:homoserine O-acetyltransferase